MKMGCHLLGTLIPVVTSALFFWEGVWCDDSGYSLNVTSPVTVQEGLCVTIPCTFTYDRSHDDRDAPLHGYWYAETQQGKLLVATNNPRKVDETGHFQGRFEMSGPKLYQGDCSLTILRSEAADNTFYFFRVEKGRRARYDYSQEGRKVSLIVTERKLDMTVSEPLRAGHNASIACTAQWCSSSGRPSVTFRGFPEDDTKMAIRNVVDASSDRYIADFIPSAADHQRNVTCIANYGTGANQVTVESTVTLNVSYIPRMFQFSGHLTLCNGSTVREFKNYTQIVAKEGSSLLVRCKTDSNPGGTERWVKKPQFLAAQWLMSDDTLQIVDLTLHDKGKYTCQAENQEGSTEGVFYLQIPHSPTPCSLVDPICQREDGGFKCNCSICSYPSSKIEWQVNGETYKGNTTNQKLKITSSNKTEEEALSILHLLGEWMENTSVICLGNNPKGQLPIKYRLLDHSNNKGSFSLISGVIGALIMFAVVMFIVTLALTCQNCRKEKKLMTDPELYKKHTSVVLTEKVQDAEGSCDTVLNLKEAKEDISKETKQMVGLPDPNPQEDDLVYSSIEFTLTRPTLEITSGETETEYAIIKSS